MEKTTLGIPGLISYSNRYAHSAAPTRRIVNTFGSYALWPWKLCMVSRFQSSKNICSAEAREWIRHTVWCGECFRVRIRSPQGIFPRTSLLDTRIALKQWKRGSAKSQGFVCTVSGKMRLCEGPVQIWQRGQFCIGSYANLGERAILHRALCKFGREGNFA